MTATESFIRDGFIRIEGAFPRDCAAECRRRLWAQIPADPDDDTTWTRPVVRVGYQAGGPFSEAVNTPLLHRAFDELVGRDRWLPRTDLGTFPIRFPSDEPPGDDGWHIDASFPPIGSDDPADPFAWRVNVASRGRVLLLLFLLSDVDEDAAPTRIRVGSHLPTARLLAPHGDDGLRVSEISSAAAAATRDLPIALATGAAGDVYLCHPFLVHASQAHRGSAPRFLAQPPLHPSGSINGSLNAASGDAPVERAIRRALSEPRG